MGQIIRDTDSTDFEMQGFVNMVGRCEYAPSEQDKLTPPPSPSPVVGIYGWRKNCLYAGLLLLTTLLIINITLTVWILKVLDFSIDGMGKLRITDKGVRLEGETQFASILKAKEIQSYKGDALNIRSDQNITMQSIGDGELSTKLVLTPEGITSSCKSLEVKTSDGRPIFYADHHETVLGPRKLVIKGPRGLTFNGSIQTPKIRADAISDLWLEAPTTRVQIQAPKGVNLFSPAGNIIVESQTDIKLQSLKRGIRLDSDNIQLKNIPVSEAYGVGRLYADVFQLCICGINGRLFMAENGQSCIATENICA